MSVIYENNLLKIDEVLINDLINKFDTPFYVYSANTIEKNFNNFKDKVSNNIFYSIKANSNLAIISLLSKLGSGFDVVSGEELQKVLKTNTNPNKIIFEGVGKKRKDLELAIKNKIGRINVESLNELKIIGDIALTMNIIPKIGIRINPDVNTQTNMKISTGKKTDKFGISIEALDQTINLLNTLKNINLDGLSCHIGSQIFSNEAYEETFLKMKDVIVFFRKKNYLIKNLSLGGGMGIDSQDAQNFDLESFKNIVDKYFKGSDLKVSFEPGRYIVAKAGTLITKIVMTKETKNSNFLIVDAGMNTFIRPALYSEEHKIIPIIDKKIDTKYIIAGPVCESSDIFSKNIMLPKQNINDFLAILNTGAYGSEMSSNYNSKGKPLELMVKENKFEIIRQPQTLEELISVDRIPDWILN